MQKANFFYLVTKLVSPVFTLVCLRSLSPHGFQQKASDVPSAVVSLCSGHSLARGTKVDKKSFSLIKVILYIIYLNVSQLNLNHKCNPLAAFKQCLCVRVSACVCICMCAAFDKADLTMMQYNVKLYKEQTFYQRGKRCSTLHIRLCDGT